MGPAASTAVEPFSKAILAGLVSKRRSDVELLVPALLRIDATVAKAIVPEIAKALAHEDPAVVRLACVALGMIGSKAKDAVPALAALLDGKEATSAVAAARALTRIGPSPDVVPALGRCVRSDDGELVIQALRALCAAGFDAKAALPDVIPVFNKLMADQNLLAVIARDMMANIGPGAAKPLIARLEKAESDEAVASAIRGLIMLGADAGDAAPLLRKIAAERENVNRRLAEEALKKVRVE